jgi:predicted amidohydrolase YtcJ
MADGRVAKAVAVADGRILAVGSNAQCEVHVGPSTRLLELDGRVVLPGFHDAHTHVLWEAARIAQRALRLEGVRRRAGVLAKVRTRAAKAPRGTWILGGGWDESLWPEGRYLTRKDLDAVAPGHPVLLIRVDGHMAAANSEALRRLAVPPRTRGFERDRHGRPTGILKEDALAVARDAVRPTRADYVRGLRTAVRRLHRRGITSVDDMVGASEGIAAYQDLRGTGRLRLRVRLNPYVPLFENLRAAGLRTGWGDSWLRLGALKVFTDGSLGARTAALRSPYTDDGRTRGLLIHRRRALQALLARAHAAGWQLAVHAIGDRAIGVALDALEAAMEARPRPDPRHRIEHLELPSDDALRRMGRGGLVASMQPNFVGRWSGPGGLYEARLGRRTPRNNPFREVGRRGVPLAFGSDGMPYGPLYGVHWAVNGHYEGQRLSVEDALRAYTYGPAHAALEDGDKGTVAPGKLADLVVLGADPRRTPPRIEDIPVFMTIVGGDVVFRR